MEGGKMLRISRSLDGSMRPQPASTELTRPHSLHAVSRLPLEWAPPLKRRGKVLDFYAHECGCDCSKGVSALKDVKLNKRSVKTVRLWMSQRKGDRGVFHVGSASPRPSQLCSMLPWKELALKRLVIRGVPVDKGSAMRAPFSSDIAKGLKELVIVFEPPEAGVTNLEETLARTLPQSLLEVPKLRVIVVFISKRPGVMWLVPSNTNLVRSSPSAYSFHQTLRKDMATVNNHTTGDIIRVAHRVLSRNTSMHLTFVNLQVLPKPPIENKFNYVASELLSWVEKTESAKDRRARLKDIAKRLEFKTMDFLGTAMANQVLKPEEHVAWQKPSAQSALGNALGLRLQ